ncbi:nuclear apoptosis-inducing factor 1-like [Tubulanus polymorphus]|uniref:nuclear apoptosis-inducing factor 1-like n=1 Tax=Tubulanus polymorphus TaxID=672921 RepID=UPI003DA58940
MNVENKAPLPAKSWKRGINFSQKEISIILELCSENASLLRSTLNNDVTIKSKQEVWSRITDAVNSIGVCRREVNDIKLKWKTMQAEAKKKSITHARDSKQTGGGPQPNNISETDIKRII